MYKMDVYSCDDYIVAEIFKNNKSVYRVVRSGAPQRAIDVALSGANLSRDEVEITYTLE